MSENAEYGEDDHSLTEKEIEDVEERTQLRPLAVYEVVRREGLEELKRPNSSLIWSGLAAGLAMGFSLLTEAALHHGLPDAPWRPLVENLGYSVGFVIVVLARQQLFTEITLTAVLPMLHQFSGKMLAGVGRLWLLVLLANLVGTALFAAMLLVPGLLSAELREAALETARPLLGMAAGTMFMRAIISGWLIATMVWLLPSAEGGKIVVIVLLTYLIALFDLTHVVAGAVEIFLLVWHGELGWIEGVVGHLGPILIGNIVGGSALFALINYGQMHEEIK